MYYQPRIDFTPEEMLEYLRKSRSDDPLMSVEQVLSNHESILDEWVERNIGGRVPDRNRFREVVSGETLKERPEITRLLRMIESPRYKAVAVVEPQRLTRGDYEDIGRLMKLLKLTNTLVVTPQRIYDLRDEYDWDAFERELKRGNDYLQYTKKILNRGRLLSVSQGNYIGSRPPYGFDKVWVSDGKRKCPVLQEKKEEADVVRMIFDMYVNQNMGRHRICNKLDEMGIRPPQGEVWSPAAMKDMLENVHYIGKVKWNWRKTISVVENSEIITVRPKSKIGEYLIYDGKHDGIIPEDLFQASLNKHGNVPRTKGKVTLTNPLAGLMFCRCGRSMIMQQNRKKDHSPRFVCPFQRKCRTGSAWAPEVIDRVCAVLEQCIADFEIRLTNETDNSAKLHSDLIKRLEKRLQELEAKERSQWEAQTDPNVELRMPPHIFKDLNEKLLKEKEEVNRALCKANESIPEPVDYAERAATFREALAALRDPETDAEAKNNLLKKCIARIEYYREPPRRLMPGEKVEKGLNLPARSGWTSPPVELDIKLKV